MVKVSQGITENGVVIGNAYDKYGSKNPLVRSIMKGFERTLDGFVNKVNPRSIHEVGCGEGYWVLRWIKEGIEATGSDFSRQVISIARENAMAVGVAESVFVEKSIYDVDSSIAEAELIVCCEVLEHLKDPEAGLVALEKVVSSHIIFSVPREPIWCTLNMMRGKYIRSFGNTPGHLQHWSKSGFVALISKHFEVIEVQSPLPWTMLLARAKR